MLVTNLHISNGVTTFAMNYYRGLVSEGVRTDLALLQDSESPYYSEIEKNGDRVFILPSVRNMGRHIKECRRILGEGRYDIVHDSSLIKTVPMMREAERAGVPVRILHSHAAKMGETPYKEFRNSVLLPALKSRANAYFACSEAAGRAMFGDAPFTVVPNVIPCGLYRFDAEERARVRSDMGIGEGETVIATVGRVAHQKNPFFAADVMCEYLKAHPKARCWWIGDGPLREKLAAYVKEKGMEGRVNLLGNRSDVRALYCAMDVFFLPSLFEGLPLTGVEAQAMGLPSLLSDSITKELIYTDLVVMESLSSPANRWCERLEELSALRPDRASYSGILGNSAFSSEGAGKRLSGLYEKLLMEKGGSPKA